MEEKSIPIEKLKGFSNWFSWKTLMQSILIEKNLWDNLMKPLDKSGFTDSQENTAMRIIRSSLSNDIIEITADCTSSHDLWVKLKCTYEGPQSAVKSKAWINFIEFLNADFGTFVERVGKFEVITSRLTSLNVNLDKDMCLAMFCYNLPSDVKTFIEHYAMSNTKAGLSEILSMARSKYHFDRQFKESVDGIKPETALYASNKKFNKKRGNYKQFQSRSNESGSSNKSGPSCTYCKEAGHGWQSCPKRNKSSEKKPQQKKNPEELNFMAYEEEFQSSASCWMSDSGANSHITPYLYLLTNYKEFRQPRKLKTGGGYVEILGLGDFVFKGADGSACRLQNVRYVPRFPKNTISCARMTKNGFKVVMDEENVMVLNKNNNDEIILKGKLCNDDLFYFFINSANESTAAATLHKNLVTSTASQVVDTVNEDNLDEGLMAVTIDEWHQRFGHISSQRLNDIKKKGLVNNMNISKQVNNTCIDCAIGKVCRTSHPARKESYSSSHTTLLTADTAGPVNTLGLNSERFLLVAVERNSGYIFVVPIKSKDLIKHEIKKIIRKIASETNRPVAEFLTDNGTEFINVELRQWLAHNGISHDTSVVGTPQQNGQAEKAVGLISSMASICLEKSGLDKSLWPEACKYAAYTINRHPLTRDPTKTRFEAYFGSKPNVANLRVFGQWLVVHSNSDQFKFAVKGIFAQMIGYTNRSNTYRVYLDKTKKIHEVCDIKWLPLGFSKQDCHEEPMEKFSDTEQYDCVNIPIADKPSVRPRVLSPKSSSKPRTSVRFDIPLNDRSPSDDATQEGPLTINDAIHREIDARQTRSKTRSALKKASDIISGTMSPIFKSPTRSNVVEEDEIHNYETIPEDATSSTLTDSELIAHNRNESNYALGSIDELLEESNMAVEFEPANYDEAIKSEESKYWLEAINKEKQAHNERGTWTVSDLPKGRKPVSAKWLFKIKRNCDGHKTYKARLVARGFSQLPGIDYYSTYAPVASLILVRLILAIAIVKKMAIYSFDVTTAFLYGDLNETIYIKPPEGFNLPQGKVFKLNKSLYGLKQSPLNWYLNLASTLEKCGLSRSKNEDCLYYDSERTTLVLIYVDDGLVVSSNMSKVKTIIETLGNAYKMKYSECKEYLGIRIDRQDNALVLSQKQFTEKILKTFGMQDTKAVATPQATIPFDATDSRVVTEDEFPFKKAIGSLLYLAMATRPDIAAAVGVAARTAAPTEMHVMLIKRIFRYLNGTKNLALVFAANKEDDGVKAYSDSDYANDVATRRSISGIAIFVFGNLVEWKSLRQPIVTLSSTEAEYVSGCTAAKELSPIVSTLKELGIQQSKPLLLIDNTSTIKISQDCYLKQRTKHIDVRARYLSEKVQQDEIEVKHVPTEAQLSDILTKPLARTTFEKLRLNFLRFCITLLCVFCLSSFTGEAYKFKQAAPVTYRMTNNVYSTGIIERKYYIDMPSPCSHYFGNITGERDVDIMLQKDCETLFRSEVYRPSRECRRKMVPPKETNIITRHKRGVIALAGIIISHTVLAGATGYSLYSGEMNNQNFKSVVKSINDHKSIFNKLEIALEEISKNQIKISEDYDQIQQVMSRLNNTLRSSVQVSATITKVYSSIIELGRVLNELEAGLRNGKLPSSFAKIIDQNPVDAQSYEYSEIQECTIDINVFDKGGLRLYLHVLIPVIDPSIHIVEADSIRVWNHTSDNKYCRLKYVGPRFTMVNSTNQCYRDVQTYWLDGNILRGHPCNDEKQQRDKIENIQNTFVEEICKEKLEVSSDDLQIRLNNGMFLIYCLGHMIKIDNESRDCPDYVFETPITVEYSLNDQHHTASSQTKIVINPLLSRINEDLLHKIHKIDYSTKRAALNNSKLSTAVNELKTAFGRAKEDLKLKETKSLYELALHPIISIVEAITKFVKEGIIVALFIACLILISMILPVVHLISGFFLRTTKFVTSNIIRRRQRRRYTYID